MSYKEISMKDGDGNLWKLSLTIDPAKTNRYQFSFFLNDKEFNLAKLQSKTLADMTWELVQHHLNKKQQTTGTIHVVKEWDGTGEKAPKKAKKKAVEVKPTQSTPEPKRPTKRVKK